MACLYICCLSLSECAPTSHLPSTSPSLAPPFYLAISGSWVLLTISRMLCFVAVPEESGECRATSGHDSFLCESQTPPGRLARRERHRSCSGSPLLLDCIMLHSRACSCLYKCGLRICADSLHAAPAPPAQHTRRSVRQAMRLRCSTRGNRAAANNFFNGGGGSVFGGPSGPAGPRARVGMEWRGGWARVVASWVEQCHGRVNFLDLAYSAYCLGLTLLSELFRLYRKPGNAYAYIPFSSFHGRHIFQGWTIADFLRLLTGTRQNYGGRREKNSITTYTPEDGYHGVSSG